MLGQLNWIHVLLQLLAQVLEWVYLPELFVQLVQLLEILYLLLFIVIKAQLIGST
jgi:hypothetical protein